MNAQTERDVLHMLGRIDEKVSGLEQDVAGLREQVAENSAQLTLWKAIRIVVAWVVGTALTVLGLAKGVDWK